MEIKNILHGLDWIHLMIRLWVINMIHAFSERMIRSRKILKFILKIFHCDFPLSSMNHIFSCKMSSPFNASINKMRNRINRNWQQILSRVDRVLSILKKLFRLHRYQWPIVDWKSLVMTTRTYSIQKSGSVRNTIRSFGKQHSS